MDINSLYDIVYKTIKNGFNNGLIRNEKRIAPDGVVHIQDQLGIDFINKVITNYPPLTVNINMAKALCISVSNSRNKNGLEWVGHLKYNNEPLVYYVRDVVWENEVNGIISDEQQTLLDAL